MKCHQACSTVEKSAAGFVSVQKKRLHSSTSYCIKFLNPHSISTAQFNIAEGVFLEPNYL